MNCLKCKGDDKVRNGKVRGRQRYRCRSCGYNYTTDKAQGKPKEMKKLALHMYLEGLGYESIGRILKVSQVSVYKWIRQAGEEVKKLLEEERDIVEEVEIDELWHYIGKKKGSAGYGLLLTEIQKKLLDGSTVIVARKQGKDYGKK